MTRDTHNGVGATEEISVWDRALREHMETHPEAAKRLRDDIMGAPDAPESAELVSVRSRGVLLVGISIVAGAILGGGAWAWYHDGLAVAGITVVAGVATVFGLKAAGSLVIAAVGERCGAGVQR